MIHKMKKLKYFLMGVPLVLLGACSDEVGTEPGTDSNPVVTMYSYSPDIADGINPDNDVLVRFATNSAVTELYYLVENEDDANKFIDEKGSDAYMQKVISEGVKIDVKGAENIDKIIQDLHGAVKVTGVALNGSSRSMAFVNFTGLDWNTICSGEFVANNIIPGSKICELQVCTTDSKLLRVKDAFKTGYSLKFNLMGLKGTSPDGAFFPVRVPAAQTGVELELEDGSSAALWVQDVAYWQENSSLATNNNYWCIMYEDYFCEFNLAWMAGSLGYVAYGSASDGQGNTSYFVPDAVE